MSNFIHIPVYFGLTAIDEVRKEFSRILSEF